MSAIRLDVKLAADGLAASRQKAQALIEAGLVSVNGKTAVKSSLNVDENDVVCVAKNDEYVGRGGKKLEKALKEFIIDVSGAVCADIGASTGGFCDCLLRGGAKRIYAVDIGRDQLDPIIAGNPSVVRIEGKNARELTAQELGGQVDFLSCDLSFISVTLLLEVFCAVLKYNAQAVILVKPQFEAGRENIGKHGIVKSEKTHIEVLEKVLNAASGAGFGVCGITYSPIKGGDGNTEYLMHLKKGGKSSICPQDIISTVRLAKAALNGKE